MDPRIQIFRDDIRYQVQGWVGDRTPELIDAIDKTQHAMGVGGDVVEIGVHHGLFMLLLAGTRRGEEAVRAFDIFDHQELNVDRSGSGARGIVEANIDRWYAAEKAHFHIATLDSMSVRSVDLPEHFPNPVKLFSVDGGHTQAHVANDLNIAQETLAPGGVAILDDFLGPHWLTVTEGYFRYMATINRRLAPFLVFQNKLYLTTFSEHPVFSHTLRGALDAWLGDEIHQGSWKYVELSGFQVLAKG